MVRFNKFFCIVTILLVLLFCVSCAKEQTLDPEIIHDALLAAATPAAEYDDDILVIEDNDVPLAPYPGEGDLQIIDSVTVESDGTFKIQVETTTGTTSVSGKSLSDEASKAIDMVNTERKAAGLSTLEFDETLGATALIRAAEITVEWSHTRPNGGTCFTLSDSIGGENLGKGYASAERAIRGWMNSAMHKSIILHSAFTRAGAAAVSVNGKTYWAFHFGL